MSVKGAPAVSFWIMIHARSRVPNTNWNAWSCGIMHTRQFAFICIRRCASSYKKFLSLFFFSLSPPLSPSQYCAHFASEMRRRTEDHLRTLGKCKALLKMMESLVGDSLHTFIATIKIFGTSFFYPSEASIVKRQDSSVFYAFERYFAFLLSIWVILECISSQVYRGVPWNAFPFSYKSFHSNLFFLSDALLAKKTENCQEFLIFILMIYIYIEEFLVTILNRERKREILDLQSINKNLCWNLNIKIFEKIKKLL